MRKSNIKANQFFGPMLTITLLIVIVSCAKMDDITSDIPASSNPTRGVVEWPSYESLLAADTHVNMDEVSMYVKLKQISCKRSAEDSTFLKEIIPVGLTEQDTLAYILNYDEGWEMIAADRRAPVVLGYCDTGNINMEELPDNIKAWMDCLMSDVKALSMEDYYKKSLTESVYDNILSSMQFWETLKELNSNSSAEKSSSNLTRGGIDDSGHWELVSSEYFYEYSINVPRLIQTDFHQDSPYNNLCPKKNLISSQRAKAGCVAVAGAQMLYYLHNTLGRPIQAASDGYCRTTISASPNYAGITITDHNSTIWSSMITNPASASYMIAEVGKNIITDYGMDVSLSTTWYLRLNVFYPAGILSEYRTYNVDSLRASIVRGMPAILCAETSTGGAHSFIIDGYKRGVKKLKETFEWQYDDYSGSSMHQVKEDSIAVTIVNPDYQLVHMNWGYGASYNNMWYSPTGDWTINGKNYSSYRYMLWDYKLINN